jgi:hypothetical protein
VPGRPIREIGVDLAVELAAFGVNGLDRALELLGIRGRQIRTVRGQLTELGERRVPGGLAGK